MSRQTIEARLTATLMKTGMVQPLDVSGRGGTMEVLCRLNPGMEPPWIQTVNSLLEAAEASGLDIRICRRYLLKSGNMVFGWYLEVRTKKVQELDGAVAVLEKVLVEAVPTLPAVEKKPVKPSSAPPTSTRTSLPDGVSPEHYRIRTLKSEIDPETGRLFSTQEMPLPHVYRDLNVPNANGKGAVGSITRNR